MIVQPIGSNTFPGPLRSPVLASEMHWPMNMELLGRVGAALGISLVLTLLLLVLYQDDTQQQPAPSTISQASVAGAIATP